MPGSSNEKISNDVMDPGKILTIRNRYFSGKYLTAADFKGEQNYFLSRSRLRNRMFHGWGMVEGLRVMHHPDPACRRTHVVVGAGVAIDCYGREVILQEDTVFRLPQELIEEEKSAKGDSDCRYLEITRGVVLFLSYDEESIDHLSVLYNENPTGSARVEHNRVSEVAGLSAVSIHAVKGACWEYITDYADMDDSHHDDERGSELASGALHPDCLCEGKIPLAIIGYNSAYTTGLPMIEMLEHLRIPSTSTKKWTRIVGYNWEHGGQLTGSQLEACHWQLKVRFSRRLLSTGEPEKDYGESESPPGPIGINNRTFTVHLIDEHSGQITRWYNGTARLDPDDARVALFQLIPDEPKSRSTKCWNVAYIVHITLKCDFILDLDENPVDGNHLRGKCPTGNGTAGGTFESWFRYDPSSSSASQEAS